MFAYEGIKAGDVLFVVTKDNRILEFRTDCIKLFSDNATIHGYVQKLYGHWATPKEYSLKNLNKRVLFTTREFAQEWIEKIRIKQ